MEFNGHRRKLGRKLWNHGWQGYSRMGEEAEKKGRLNAEVAGISRGRRRWFW
jgi:hypothetical protein